VVVTISIQKAAFFLWIIHEAPCFIPCNYVVNEFVVFIIGDVTRNAYLCSFLFKCQHSRYQMLMNAKHVQHMQNTVTTSYRNSNLWCNLGHRFTSVTSHNLSHTFDICFICWHCWAITTANTSVSIIEVFMPITHLRFFSLLCHHTLAAIWLMSPLVTSAAKQKVWYSYIVQLHFQLWHNLTHAKETNNCYYALRGYEMLKQSLWLHHQWCQLMMQKISLVPQFL
jgi:hypothetical protein